MHESEEIQARDMQASSVPKWQRFFEMAFGWLAKATMIVVAIAGFILCFPESLAGIPTTKKELLIFFLLGIVGVIGTLLLFYFHIR